MRTHHAVVAAASAAALAVAPLAGAAAVKPDQPGASGKKKEKAGLAVTQLSLKGKKTVDVADADAKVKVRVQVKDRSKAFDPAKVRIQVVEKESGAEAETFTVGARLVGRSKKVSSWVGKVTVPKGSVEPGTQARYCVRLVKVVPDDPQAEPVVATAKGLESRDCVTVVNRADAS